MLNPTIREIIQNSQINKLETKLLLREVLGLSAAKLISNNNYLLSMAEYQKFNLLVKQRKDGIPISYILGKKEFFSRIFKVNSNTLTPRPETEILVESVLNLIKNISKPKMIDLGTGSGCIAITCKLERSDIEVTATDISQNALNVAVENAEILGAKINFALGDWFSGISETFDIIVSNPPYIANGDKHLLELKYEPLMALTDFADGLKHIRQIANQSPYFLKTGGYLIVEHGFDQGKMVRDIFLKVGFGLINTIKDYSGCERITYGMKI